MGNMQIVVGRISVVTWGEQEIKITVLFYLTLERFNGVYVYNVISLKQRSTCRQVTYFDTTTYVQEQMSLLFSHHIYEGIINTSKR
jgi:hypothetical protein